MTSPVRLLARTWLDTVVLVLPTLVVLAAPPAAGQHQAYQSGPLSKEGSPFTGLAQAPEANLFLGAATTVIPMLVPPGRHEMTPRLALSYSSSGGPSLYGFGWDLTLGRIQRSTTHGVLTCANLGHLEEFVLVLPGQSVEFVRDPAGKGLPRVQESFLKIQHTAALNSWTVWDKSGLKYVFGATTPSRSGNTVAALYDNSPCPLGGYGPLYTFSWNLTSIEDPNGNRLEIDYSTEQGVAYPERIRYGGHTNGFPHQFEVDFVWVDPRPAGDELVNGMGGFPARLHRMLDRVDVRRPVGGPLVRRYRLDYETELGPARMGRQTFLTAVTLYNGSDQALARYDGLPASSTFLYHENTDAQFAFGVPQNAVKPAAPPGLLLNHGRHSDSATTRTTRDVFDITGDGIPDWIVAPASSLCAPNNAFWYVYPGTSAGFDTAPITWDAPACLIRDGFHTGDPIQTYGTKDTLDLNGDGFPDFIDTTVWTTSSPRWNVYFGSPTAGGGGFAATAFPWPAPLRELRHTIAGDVSGYGYSPAPGSVDLRDLIDMNGDGLPDLVQVGSASGDWTVWLNTGGGFAASRVLAVGLTGSPLRWTRERDEIIAIRDMNGDGLPDHLFTGFGNVPWPGFWYVYLNSGHGLELEEHWALPAAVGGHMRRMSDGFEEIIRDVIDINGDALPDLVDQTGWSSNSPYWRVVLNRGDGFSESVLAWRSPLPLIRDGGDDGHTHKDTLDIDGDGLVDHVDFTPSSAIAIYRNAGGAWCASTNGTSCALTAANGVAASSALRPDLLVRFENGIGATTTLEYRPSTQWDNTGGDGIPDLPLNTWTVTRLEQDDGMCNDAGTACVNAGAHTRVTNLTYLYGRLDASDRAFRGFQLVTARDSDSPSAPHQGRNTYFHQGAALVGKIQDQWVYDGSAGPAFGPLSRTVTTWECANPNTGATIACPAQPGGNVWARLKRTEEFTFNDFSLISYKRAAAETHGWHQCGGTFYGNIAHSSRGDPQGSPRVHSHSEYGCLDSGSAYIVDKPTHVWTNASNDTTTLEEKWFFYDQQGLGGLTKGNLTKQETWLDVWATPPTSCSVGTKNCVSTVMGYDAYGNLTLTFDPMNRQTQSTYDTATQIYPNVVTGPAPFQQKTATEYDPACGTLLWQSVTYTGTTIPAPRSRREYDSFCRLRKTALPDEDIANSPHHIVDYFLGGPQHPSRVRTWTKEPAAFLGYKFAHTLTDALGRVIQQAQTSVVAGTPGFLATATIYDERGNVQQQSAPFPTSAPATFTMPPAGTGMTTFAYDTVNRVTAVTNPDGSTRATDYGVAWETTSTDECYAAPTCLGGKTVEVRDALARPVEKRVYEEDTFKTRTVYTYDELGRLVTTRQGSTATGSLDENTRVVVTYDTLGRKLEMADPDSGTWRYGYDRVGSMKYQDDPKTNQHVQYCYDNLNRVTLECPLNGDYSGSNIPCTSTVCSTDEVRSFYDDAQVANALGRLTRVTDGSGETRFEAYDVRGRPLRVTKEIDANGDGQDVTSATTEYTYDAADHLKDLEYPDGELVRYEYNPAGQVNKVTSVTHNVDYVSSLTYDMFGRPIAIDHGNGTKDTREFGEADTNYRLSSLSTYAGIHVRLLFSFPNYTPTGLLKQIVDDGPKGTNGIMDNSASFTYDGIGRLTQASGAQLGTFSYQYDYLGNMTAKEGTTLTYLTAKPHTLWTINGSPVGIGHDTNGNRTGKPGQTYGYDRKDRLTSINNGQVQFRYDYTGRRVAKIVNGDTLTAYYSDLFESSGGWVTKYYYAGNQLITSRRKQAAGFASVGEPAVRIASVSLTQPALMLMMRRDLQIYVALTATLFAAGFVAFPTRRKRVVGIAVRHGHVIGVTAAFTLGSFPWPILMRPAEACLPPPQFVFHYHTDHLGSTQLVTNTSGAAVEYVRYRPYGQVRGRYNASGSPLNPSEIHRYEFTGYESEFLSGLQYAGARFYDPILGSFLTHDPARQFPSPYAYGPWSPLNGTDPNGAFWPALIEIVKVIVISATVSAAVNTVIAAAQGAGLEQIGQAAMGGAITGAVGAGLGVVAAGFNIGLASLANTLPADFGGVNAAMDALVDVAKRSAFSTGVSNAAGQTAAAAGAPDAAVAAVSVVSGYLASAYFDQNLLNPSGDLAQFEEKGLFQPVSNTTGHTNETYNNAADVFGPLNAGTVLESNLAQDGPPGLPWWQSIFSEQAFENQTHFGFGAQKAFNTLRDQAVQMSKDRLFTIGAASHYLQDQYALGHIFPGTHLLAGRQGWLFRGIIHQTFGGEVTFSKAASDATLRFFRSFRPI